VYLRALGEPSLCDLSRQKQEPAVYRLFWIPSGFGEHPICVAAERLGGKPVLRLKVLDGNDGPLRQLSVAIDRTIPLSDQQWKALTESFDNAAFWNSPITLECDGGTQLDGDVVVIEAASNGRYHVVDREDLDPALESLCRRLLDLCGLEYQRLWRDYHPVEDREPTKCGDSPAKSESR
jgi:hypothetical protein